MRVKRKKICPNSCSLPREVTLIILSKLPCKAILRSKAVCKEWLDIVTSDPVFAKRHYENNFMTLLCRKAVIEGFKKISNNKRGWFYKLDSYRIHRLVPPRSIYWDGFHVVNSCKGFLLVKERPLDSYMFGNYLVCNPLTNERVLLPNIPAEYLCDYYGWPVNVNTNSRGLGFSPVTKRFKVVIFLRKKWLGDICGLHAYTFGSGDESRTHGDSTTDAWRTLSLTDGDRHILRDDIKNNPIELNGVLHWDTTEDRIVCFDVEKEELGEMSYPCSGESANHSIGVYKGLLCLGIVTELGNSGKVEMWVMKEYGINESWMRLVVVKEVLANKSIYGCPGKDFKLQQPKLLNILDNGEMIFLATLRDFQTYHLFSYDPIKECFENLSFPKCYSALRIDIYTPSFFSLKLLNSVAS